MHAKVKTLLSLDLHIAPPISNKWLPNGTTRTTHSSPTPIEQKQKQATTSSHPYEKASKLTSLATILVWTPQTRIPLLKHYGPRR